MAVKPIIFSGPMVRALRDGRKRQTRRVLKDAPIGEGGHGWRAINEGDCLVIQWPGHDSSGGRAVNEKTIVPPYAVGDLLWVRETWRTLHRFHSHPVQRGAAICYEADRTDDGFLLEHGGRFGRLRSSIHMPRWASRLTLRVTGVKVEQLHDISEEDAIAEGLRDSYPDRHCKWRHPTEDKAADLPSIAFGWLWNTIHGDDAWQLNPWVCAITFEVIHKQVDATLKALATTDGEKA